MESLCAFCNNIDRQNEIFNERYDYEMDGTAQAAFDCAPCARAYEAYKRVMDEVRSLPAPDVPIDFHARVMKAVRHEQAAQKGRVRRLTSWTSLAAACFIFATVVWMGVTPNIATTDEAPHIDMSVDGDNEREVFGARIAPMPANAEIEGYGGGAWLDNMDVTDIDRLHLARPLWADEANITGFNDVTFMSVTEPVAATRSGLAIAGAITLLIGGLGATLMAVVAYKKP